MTLTPHQEHLLSETHVLAQTTKAMLEVHVKDITDAKVRVDRLEKKLNFFMGAWAAVSAIAGAIFAWFLEKGQL